MIHPAHIHWIAVLRGLIVYAVCAAVFLVGAYLAYRRNPQTHFGMAQEYEKEGNLDKALAEYRLAARYGADRLEGRLAKERIAELTAQRQGTADRHCR